MYINVVNFSILGVSVKQFFLWILLSKKFLVSRSKSVQEKIIFSWFSFKFKSNWLYQMQVLYLSGVTYSMLVILCYKWCLFLMLSDTDQCYHEMDCYLGLRIDGLYLKLICWQIIIIKLTNWDRDRLDTHADKIQALKVTTHVKTSNFENSFHEWFYFSNWILKMLNLLHFFINLFFFISLSIHFSDITAVIIAPFVP